MLLRLSGHLETERWQRCMNTLKQKQSSNSSTVTIEMALCSVELRRIWRTAALRGEQSFRRPHSVVVFVWNRTLSVCRVTSLLSLCISSGVSHCVSVYKSFSLLRSSYLFVIRHTTRSTICQFNSSRIKTFSSVRTVLLWLLLFVQFWLLVTLNFFSHGFLTEN